MSALLPTFPYVVFCILEPISLVLGFATAWFDNANFIADQYPQPTLKAALPQTHAENAQILAYQLGNLYLLMAILGVCILNTTKDYRIVQLYLISLAIGDIGHIAPTLMVLGKERVLDVSSWNAMAWGNIAATVFLFTVRISELLGLFGKANGRAAAKPKKS